MSAARQAVERAEPIVDRPYPGPSPFTRELRRYFFGRDADVENLRALLRTERIVVLHSPSGAGKTSLLHASLLPRMAQDGFWVLPTIRVSIPLPANAPKRANRYAYSVIKSLEAGLIRPDTVTEPRDDEMVGVSLANYFTHRSTLHERRSHGLLVFDQFEELFTAAPGDHRGRVAFFTDLAAVLHERGWWALFSMREEYVAALDTYKRLVPAELSARYHLDYLTAANAAIAIEEPAQVAGVAFETDARDALLRDLTGIPDPVAHSAEDESVDRGEFVDPLQLQLVCAAAWESKRVDRSRITLRDIETMRVGSTLSRPDSGELTAVDMALQRYVDERLSRIHEATGCAERSVREWMEVELLAQGGFRRQALAAEPNERPALAAAQRFLDEEHILRSTMRAGRTWYELAHDRMVDTFLNSNARWLRANLTTFEWRARDWAVRNRPGDYQTASDDELRRFESAAESIDEGGPEHEWAYLEHCRGKNQRKKKTRLLRWGLWAVVILVIGVLMKDAIERMQLNLNISELKREAGELEREVGKGRVNQLVRNAMRQRYFRQNHDVALLLGALATDHNDRIANPADRASPIEAESALRSALRAVPFSQTIPSNLIPGTARALELHPSGIEVLLDQSPATPVSQSLVIDLTENSLHAHSTCTARYGRRSPASGLLAFASTEGKGITIVDPETCVARGHKRLPSAPDAEQAPEWSPDGEYLATFLDDGSVAVHSANPARDEPLAHITENAAIRSVAFDDGMFATGDDEGNIRLYDLRDGAVDGPVSPLPPRQDAGAVKAMAFTTLENTPWLAAVHADGTILIYAVRDQVDRPYELVPDPRSALRESIRRRTKDPSGEPFDSARFSDDGRWLVTGSRNGAVIRWDLSHASLGSVDAEVTDSTLSNKAFRAPRKLLGGLKNRPLDVLATKDGATVFAVERTGEVRQWEEGRRDRLYRYKNLNTTGVGSISALAFTVRNELDVVTDFGQVRRCSVSLDDRDGLKAPSCRDSVAGPSNSAEPTPEFAAVDQSRRWLAVSSSTGEVSVIDMRGNACAADKQHQPGNSCLAVSVSTAGKERRVNAIAISPDGAVVSVGGDDGLLMWWRVEVVDGKPPTLVRGDPPTSRVPGNITAMAFHPDGTNKLVTASTNGSLQIWTLVGPRAEPDTPKDGRDALRTVKFSGSGSRVTAMAFYQDGANKLVTAHADGVLRIWDLDAPGAQPNILEGEGAELRAVAIRGDGRIVAAGDLSGRLLLWDLRPRSYVCRVVRRNLTVDEWDKYVPSAIPQERVCPGLPSEVAELTAG